MFADEGSEILCAAVRYGAPGQKRQRRCGFAAFVAGAPSRNGASSGSQTQHLRQARADQAKRRRADYAERGASLAKVAEFGSLVIRSEPRSTRQRTRTFGRVRGRVDVDPRVGAGSAYGMQMWCSPRIPKIPRRFRRHRRTWCSRGGATDCPPRQGRPRLAWPGAGGSTAAASGDRRSCDTQTHSQPWVRRRPPRGRRRHPPRPRS